MVSPAGTPRSSTPNPNTESSNIDTAAEDATLQQLALVMTDIRAMETQMWQLWQEAISVMLPELSEGETEAATADGAPICCLTVW